jgi:cation diffusion facilitator CzcD-associated flavoprotein CzcO
MRIGIVGTGFGGIGMAIQLLAHGFDDVTLFERSDRVGGTWRENRYPGAACDVPSHLYSFSFEIKHDWSRAFAEQPEILAYLEHCAAKYDLVRRIRFRTEVVSATHDGAGWTVRLGDGQDERFDVFIAACGQLGRPAIPALPGRFAGPQMHSATWRDDVALEGKRVAVIGSGASAIQFVPPVAARAEHLTLFQRTPPWILRKRDRAYPAWERALYRAFPFLQAAHRAFLYWTFESRVFAFRPGTVANWLVRRFALAQLRRGVPDPALREKLVPDYTPGCKRMLISNDWYPTLARDNVTVVSSGVRELTETGVVDCDGVHHAADVLLWGTGFRTTEFLVPMTVTGPSGMSLAEAWQDGAEAYLGITVTGFPNLFLLYGPNTNLGHNSIIFMLEAQIGYIVDAIRLLRETGARSLEVKPEVQRAFDAEMQARLEQSVWSSGCSNWYRHASGKGTNNWPGPTLEYWRRTRQVDPDDYLTR